MVAESLRGPEAVRIATGVRVIILMALAATGVGMLAPGLLARPTGASARVLADDPAPLIDFLEPPAAAVGGPAFSLAVRGSGFLPPSVVLWNGEPRATLYVSPTQLSAEIAAADLAMVRTAQVTVLNPAPAGGVSPATDFVVGEPNPVPEVTGLSPAQAQVGDEAFGITVIGSGFVRGSTVMWNGQSRDTGFVGPLMLSATIRAADVASAGAAYVSVVSPPPGGGQSQAARVFTVVSPTPALETLEPAAVWAGGPAFTLIARGSRFTPSTVVQWAGADRPTTYVSAERVEAQISAVDTLWAGTPSVRVFTPAPGGGLSAALAIAVEDDGVPPVTTVTGLKSTWNRTAVTLTFVAADVGVGVERTFYRMGAKGDFSTGTRVRVPAPKTHKNDGLYVVEYFSIDKVLNWEKTKRVGVGIDTQPPTSVVGNALVERGSPLRVRYRIADPVSPATLGARLVISDAAGKVVLRQFLGGPRTNEWHGSPACTVRLVRGTYRMKVLASDLAGNPQSEAVAGRLNVL